MCRRNFNNCERTDVEPSRTNGKSLGSMIAKDIGIDVLTGCDAIAVVR
jgi:hypothetical protein